tara:strand:+ start:571 stop:939 length:369 start_codon:yes stop_codon:yes gene_type:complete
MENLRNKRVMKHYQIYVFTQDNCPPCAKLKDHLETLTPSERGELHLVPLKAPSGSRTALAEELQVELSPTLVVVSEEVSCSVEDGEEYCTQYEDVVEKVVGAKAIIAHLDADLDSYTYAHPE